MDVLFRSVDALEELLESTLAGTSAAISTHLIQQLRQLTDTAPGAQAEVQVETDRGFRLDAFDLDTINQAGAQGLKAYAVHITLRPNTLLKSVRVFTIFQALETIGTIIKSYPPAHDLEDERFDLDFSLLVLTAEQSSSVQQLVEGISEIDAVEVEEVRVSQGQARSEAAAALEPSSGSSDFLKAAQVQQRGSDKYVRIETERLDKLINLVGELVISRTQVMEMVKDLNDSDQKSVVGQLDRVTTELQHAAMNLRMVPIRHVFHRFPRMVRSG